MREVALGHGLSLDGYRLGRCLREGKRATVHYATDAEGREWALKRFRAGDPAAEKEWGLEVPDVPGLLLPAARGRDGDGSPWLVFPYCPGGDLGARLARRLPVPALIFLMKDVLMTLEGLHARGLVHRDLSPFNLLFDAGSSVRLGDLGCLLKAGERPDIPRDGLGTVAYAAPEQLLGGPAEPSSDLYALGAICYECLSGAPPFPAEAPERRAARKARGGPPPLPGALGALAGSLMDPDPRRRPSPRAALERLDGCQG